MGVPDASPEDRLFTIEEFERLPEDDRHKFELVRGRLVRESRPGARHGRLGIKLGRRLDEFAIEHDLGLVFTDTGFTLFRDPDTLRGPDLSFVSRARIPASGYAGTFWQLAPDLAVEILSPSNRPGEMREKVSDYLAAGSLEVWVVDAERQLITVHRRNAEVERLEAGDTLDGGAVLPGFRLPLAELFGMP